MAIKGRIIVAQKSKISKLLIDEEACTSFNSAVIPIITGHHKATNNAGKDKLNACIANAIIVSKIV